MIVTSRTYKVTVPRRSFVAITPKRNFLAVTQKRNFLSVVPKRDFGFIVTDNLVEIDDPEDAWIRWGQTNVYPFDYPDGTDSTKTYGELP